MFACLHLCWCQLSWWLVLGLVHKVVLAFGSGVGLGFSLGVGWHAGLTVSKGIGSGVSLGVGLSMGFGVRTGVGLQLVWALAWVNGCCASWMAETTLQNI